MWIGRFVYLYVESSEEQVYVLVLYCWVRRQGTGTNVGIALGRAYALRWKGISFIGARRVYVDSARLLVVVRQFRYACVFFWFVEVLVSCSNVLFWCW